MILPEWIYNRAVSADAEIEIPDSSSWQSRSLLVKQNRRRSVYRLPPADDAGAALYIKHDHPAGLWSRIKNLWRCKAREEFRALLALAEHAVPVTPAVAWGRNGKDSFLATLEIKDARLFDDLWETCRHEPRERALFLAGLAQFVKILARAGVAHPDMHTGNVLGKLEHDAVRFFLVDAYGVKILPQLNEHQHISLWLWLAKWVNMLTEAEKREFILQSTGLALPEAQDFWQRFERCRVRKAGSYWRNRRKKVLGESSLCSTGVTSHGRWLCLRPFPLEAAAAAVEQHFLNLKTRQDILKLDKKRQLSRVSADGRSLVVKEFRHPGWCWRWRPDCRSWLNTYRLATYAIPGAGCYAWLRHKDGRGFLILEDLGGLNLRLALEGAQDDRRRRYLLRSGARLAAKLHHDLILHKDMKLANIILADAHQPAPLSLIDLDDMNFNRRITPALRAKNLCQMLNSFPDCISDFSRRRFLACYRQEARIDKKLMQQVISHLKRFFLKQ